jgi:hypothetical protein
MSFRDQGCLVDVWGIWHIKRTGRTDEHVHLFIKHQLYWTFFKHSFRIPQKCSNISLSDIHEAYGMNKTDKHLDAWITLLEIEKRGQLFYLLQFMIQVLTPKLKDAHRWLTIIHKVHRSWWNLHSKCLRNWIHETGYLSSSNWHFFSSTQSLCMKNTVHLTLSWWLSRKNWMLMNSVMVLLMQTSLRVVYWETSHYMWDVSLNVPDSSPSSELITLVFHMHWFTCKDKSSHTG